MITYVMLDLVMLTAILFIAAFQSWKSADRDHNIANPIFSPVGLDWLRWTGNILYVSAILLAFALIVTLETLVGLSMYFTFNPPS